MDLCLCIRLNDNHADDCTCSCHADDLAAARILFADFL